MARKLAAILAADVVGYSKLMADDEAGTMDALRRHRREVFDPEIQARGGRIVKLMGDGTLVEFASVVDAVEAALAIQRTLAAGGGSIQLRIGINLGDVIIDGDDLYGDGVNVAARPEALAESGGICISSIVHESIGNRVEASFQDTGAHAFKNIARPICTYRWSTGDTVAPAARDSTTAPPDRTISITPFENQSNDPELGFFCNGVAEDIAAAITNVGQLTVVDETHLEADGGGAHIVLTGGARKSGKRIRVAARLVERRSGVQLWADRFEGDAGDLFETQDDVTRRIVIAVHTERGAGAYTNHWQWGSDKFETWQLMAKGLREFQKFSPESMRRTIALWEQASNLDDGNLAPLIGTAYCRSHLALITDGAEGEILLDQAQATVDRARAEMPEDVRIYSAARGIAIARGDFDAAVAAAEEALALYPDDAACRGTYAMALMSADNPREALAQITRAEVQMTELPGWIRLARIESHYMLDQLPDAHRLARETVREVPDFYPGPILLAALASETGNDDEAVEMCERVLAADPHFSAGRFVRSLGLKNQAFATRHLDALRGAGLPG